MDKATLRPCPFCGGNNIGEEYITTYSIDSSYNTLGCCTCQIRMEIEEGPSPRDIAAWNTRPIEDKLKRDNEALLEALKRAERALTELYPSEPCKVEHEAEYYAVNNVLNKARAAIKQAEEGR